MELVLFIASCNNEKINLCISIAKLYVTLIETQSACLKIVKQEICKGKIKQSSDTNQSVEATMAKVFIRVCLVHR
jgi:hypothetical protein